MYKASAQITHMHIIIMLDQSKISHASCPAATCQAIGDHMHTMTSITHIPLHRHKVCTQTHPHARHSSSHHTHTSTLRYALTSKEVKSILMQRLVKIDGKVRTDSTYPLGFMDVIDIEKTDEHFRLVYDSKGRFVVHRISKEESTYKLCQVGITASADHSRSSLQLAQQHLYHVDNATPNLGRPEGYFCLSLILSVAHAVCTA